MILIQSAYDFTYDSFLEEYNLGVNYILKIMDKDWGDSYSFRKKGTGGVIFFPYHLFF